MKTFVKTTNGSLINLDLVKEIYINKGEYASDVMIETTERKFYVVFEIPKEENDNLKEVEEYLDRIKFITVGKG